MARFERLQSVRSDQFFCMRKDSIRRTDASASAERNRFDEVAMDRVKRS